MESREITSLIPQKLLSAFSGPSTVLGAGITVEETETLSTAFKDPELLEIWYFVPHKEILSSLFQCFSE